MTMTETEQSFWDKKENKLAWEKECRAEAVYSQCKALGGFDEHFDFPIKIIHGRPIRLALHLFDFDMATSGDSIEKLILSNTSLFEDAIRTNELKTILFRHFLDATPALCRQVFKPKLWADLTKLPLDIQYNLILTLFKLTEYTYSDPVGSLKRMATFAQEANSVGLRYYNANMKQESYLYTTTNRFYQHDCLLSFHKLHKSKSPKLGITDSIIQDTVEMFHDVGRRVNPNWSWRRFKEEHDKISKEIAAKKKLEMAEQEKDFQWSEAKWDSISHFEGDDWRADLIRSYHDLYQEGEDMHHCVFSNYGKQALRAQMAVYKIIHKGIRYTASFFPSTIVNAVGQIAHFKTSYACKAVLLSGAVVDLKNEDSIITLEFYPDQIQTIANQSLDNRSEMQVFIEMLGKRIDEVAPVEHLSFEEILEAYIKSAEQKDVSKNARKKHTLISRARGDHITRIQTRVGDLHNNYIADVSAQFLHSVRNPSLLGDRLTDHIVRLNTGSAGMTGLPALQPLPRINPQGYNHE